VVVRASSEALAGGDAAVQAAWACVRARSHAPLRPPTVVAASGVSRRTLERRIQAHFGCSIQELIWRAHVDRAKRLLQESEQDLLGIALDSGFTSASAFATIFKRHAGLSPRAWRAHWRSLADPAE
jgi:AraC-like DNA-binding protein